ncbi:MAG: DUF1365 domain-containing protein [Pseudorhodobacter sp.]
MTGVSHLRGQTFHGRRGSIANSFRYGVDYVLLDPETVQGPRLFSRNRRNLMSLWDTDHGGAPKAGRGQHWVREVLADHGLPAPIRIRLLAQPRVLGHVFNPVSFWLCEDAAGALFCVIAEVSNTFGDRHSYLCHRDDHGSITRHDLIEARKIFHVSPFQPIAGGYRFRFHIRPDRIGIWIDFSAGENGLYATLTGRLAPLTDAAILGISLRRPLGSRRVLALIHWQAMKLWWKGARFFSRPPPPQDEVTR